MRRHLSRASLLAIAIVAASAASIAADAPITDEARTHFATDINLLRDPNKTRYKKAYREFKATYASSPSYKILNTTYGAFFKDDWVLSPKLALNLGFRYDIELGTVNGDIRIRRVGDKSDDDSDDDSD